MGISQSAGEDQGLIVLAPPDFCAFRRPWCCLWSRNSFCIKLKFILRAFMIRNRMKRWFWDILRQKCTKYYFCYTTTIGKYRCRELHKGLEPSMKIFVRAHSCWSGFQYDYDAIGGNEPMKILVWLFLIPPFKKKKENRKKMKWDVPIQKIINMYERTADIIKRYCERPVSWACTFLINWCPLPAFFQ